MLAAFAVVLGLSRHVFAGCVLPIRMEGFQPTAMVTLSDKLVITNSAGVLLFVDLDDFIHQHDLHVFREAPGANIQGLTVTNPESTYLYLGAEHAAEVLEYEWHSSHKIFRKFQLLGLPGSNGHPGLQSLTFVPTPASSEEGYFYASTGTSGAIYIYEVPLLSEGTLESASSVSEWNPNPRKTASHHARGLAYADGYLFVCFALEDSTLLQIFHVLASGRPGSLREEHHVDVLEVADLAVRKAEEETWHIFFISKEKPKVYGYSFRFFEGFQLHPYCAPVEVHTVDSNAMRSAWLLAVFLSVMAI